MGRFSKLDFDSRPQAAQSVAAEDPWPDLDEQGCLAAAEDQFLRGLYEAALVFYSRALRFNRELLPAWIGQVRCLLHLGEYREAVTWSIRALERFPDQPDLLAYRGLALVRAGSLREGIEFVDGAVELKSPSAWVWLTRGEALLAARQPAANARRCFLKARELAPDDWRVALQIGMIYNGAGFAAEARAPLLAASRHAGDNPVLLYHLGRMYEATGERGLADGCYQRARAARPELGQGPEWAPAAPSANPLRRLWGRLTGKR